MAIYDEMEKVEIFNDVSLEDEMAGVIFMELDVVHW